MNTQTFSVFAGIDWAEKDHKFDARGPDGSLLAQGTVPHSASGLAKLVGILLPLANGDPAAIAVAVETNHGPVVETCLAYGFAVFSINPKQLDRFRDRFAPAGSKSDELDAYVLADSLRTDMHLFRAVELSDERTLRLRALVSVREDLDRQLRRLANRLRDLLVHNAPGLLELSPAADTPLLWALLEHVDSFPALPRLQVRTVAGILKNRRIRRISAGAVAEALRKPSLIRAPGAPEAAWEQVRYLLPQLRLIHQQVRDCEKLVTEALTVLCANDPDEAQPESPDPDAPQPPSRPTDAEIIRSCPGIGPTIAAALLTEADGAIRKRDLPSLRALCGVAPVTRRSGKSLLVCMRYACRERLRQAVHAWGLGATRCDTRAHEHYTRLRARGYNHNRAVRGVVDRLLAMLIAMLRDNTLYDPAKRIATLA